MRIGVLASVAHSVPPRAYGPWETVAALLADGLAARGHDVTLFASGDSRTRAALRSRIPWGYEESEAVDARIATTLHIAFAMEQAAGLDIISNQFDFPPLAYSRMTATPMVTTIHGFSSEDIVEVYREYDADTHYVAISDANRHRDLAYSATIHHGIPVERMPFGDGGGGYLVALGRIHPDKGTREAIDIALGAGLRLIIAGTIHDAEYHQRFVAPRIDGHRVGYVGNLSPRERDLLLAGARAMLHPIGFDEPFGLAVVEALAVGTPVIAFDRGSMPELIAPGRTGYLVGSVAEAIEVVGRTRSLDRRHCRAEAIERFTVDRMLDDYEKLFATITAS